MGWIGEWIRPPPPMRSLQKVLGDGERIELDLRPHGKALVRPVLVLVGLAFLASYAFFSLPTGPTGGAPLARWAVLCAALGLVTWWVVPPLLRWRTSTAVATNRRIVVRAGIVSRIGQDVPLHRITDVSFAHGLLDRVLGCGTVTLSTTTMSPVPSPTHATTDAPTDVRAPARTQSTPPTERPADPALSSARRDRRLVLPDVPHVEVVQRELYRLLEEDDLRRRRLGGADEGGQAVVASDPDSEDRRRPKRR